MRRFFARALTLMVCLSAAGCGGVQLDSREKDRDIIIDGRADDWHGALELVEGAGVSFGLMNDENSLYVALATADRGVQHQIMASGLYVWLNRGKEKAKDFGVCFPIGLEEVGSDTPQERRGRPDSLRTAFLESTRDLVLYSALPDAWDRAPAGSLGGVEAAAGFEAGRLVIEFEIPLQKDPATGYGIGAAPKDIMTLGLYSPRPQRRQTGDRPQRGEGLPSGGEDGSGGRPDQGGGSPGGGGRWGGDGAPGGGRGFEPPEPIEVWATVRLSARSSD